MTTAAARGGLAPALERTLALLEPAARQDATADRSLGGYLDLLGGDAPESTGPVQDFMLSRFVPQIYERWWRPALSRAIKGVLGPGMADERRIARLLLGLTPGDGVLDVACGSGNFTRDFARSVGPEGLAVGVDVSRTMLSRAVADTERAGVQHAAYIRASAQELPFRQQSFDAVCCFAALHLFPDPEAALDSMTSVLTPGGRIALFTSARVRTAPLRTAEELAGRRSGMRIFGEHEVIELLERRGFEDVRQRLAGFTQFVGGRLSNL